MKKIKIYKSFFVFYLILANKLSFAYIGHVNEFIETILICKQNIDQLDLLPTILKQKGWEDYIDVRKYTGVKKQFKKGSFIIGFDDNPGNKICVARALHNLKTPFKIMDEILQKLPVSNEKITGCRYYDKYPLRIIEWQIDKLSYVRYLTSFNGDHTFSQSISIKRNSLSNNVKFFSLCTKGDL